MPVLKWGCFVTRALQGTTARAAAAAAACIAVRSGSLGHTRLRRRPVLTEAVVRGRALPFPCQWLGSNSWLLDRRSRRRATVADLGGADQTETMLHFFVRAAARTNCRCALHQEPDRTRTGLRTAACSRLNVVHRQPNWICLGKEVHSSRCHKLTSATPATTDGLRTKMAPKTTATSIARARQGENDD